MMKKKFKNDEKKEQKKFYDENEWNGLKSY